MLNEKELKIKILEMLEKIGISIDLIKNNNIDNFIIAMNTQKTGSSNLECKNSKLAQLGDAILKFVTTDYFYRQSNTIKEIQKYNENYTNDQRMAKIRNFLKINEFIHNNNYWLNDAPQHDRPTCSDTNDSCIEAIIGAIYLSIDFNCVREWVIKNILVEYEFDEFITEKNGLQIKH